MAEWSNWAETVNHPELAKVYEPRDLDELVADVNEAVANGWKVRAVGTGHAWSNLGLPDGQQAAIVLTDKLQNFRTTADPSVVEVQGGIKIERLTKTLSEHALALPNMGDANPQGLAGALATETHGSGAHADLGSFSELVEGMTVVTAGGEARELNEQELRAGRVSLGKLGVVYSVRLKVVPLYYLRQRRELVVFANEEPLLHDLMHDHRHLEYWYYPYTGRAERITRWIVHDHVEENAMGPFDRLGIRASSRFVNYRGKRDPASLPSLFDRLFTDDCFRTEERQGPWHDILVGNSNIWRDVVKTYTMEYQFGMDKLWDAFADLEASIEVARQKGVYVAAPIQFRFTPASSRSILTHLLHEPTVSFSVSFHSNHAGGHTFLPELEQRFLALGGKPHWGKMYYVRPDIDSEFEAIRAALDPDGVFNAEQPLYVPDAAALLPPEDA